MTARTVKTLPILGSAACALLLAAAPASADLYASSITAPTSDPTFWVYNGDAPMQELISGTITDVSSSPSDLPTSNQAQCYTGIAQPPVAPSPVASFTGPTVLISGHEYGWGAQSSISGLKGEACTLVLVPSDVAGSFPFSSMVFEGSPRVFTGWQELNPATGLPSPPNVTPNFLVQAPQAAGKGIYYSAGYCGLGAGYTFDITSMLRSQNSAFDCADYLWDGNGETLMDSTRSSIQVDGVNAYLPAAADDLAGAWAPSGQQSVDWGTGPTWDPTNGSVTFTETEPVVECAQQPAVFPPTSGSCSSFVSAGVSLRRTITQNASSVPQTTISDAWISTDGRLHSLDLLVDNSSDSSAAYTSFSWMSGAGTHIAGETLAGPSGPAVIRLSDPSHINGGPGFPAAAIVLHQAPKQVVWLTPGTFQLEYQGTVPAGGTYANTSDYVWSTSNAEITSTANALWDAAQAPSIAITSPGDHTTVTTPQITVKGSANDPVGIASFSVNGQAVGVASDGSWTAPVTLAPGANTITANATNESGQQSSASITVTYAPASGGGGSGAVMCVVPNLVGETVTQATAALSANHCALGAVHQVKGHGKPGTIVAQGAPAGWQNASGTAVSVAVLQGQRTGKHHRRHHRRH